MLDPSIQKQWVDALQKVIVEEPTKLSVWEKDFVEGCARRLETLGYLTDSQDDILERVYAAKTD
jgi:hypothetical protein